MNITKTAKSKKKLALLIAFIFAFTTVIAPVNSFGLNTDSATEVSQENENIDENAESGEATQEEVTQDEEISDNVEDEIPELKGEYAEGEAIVCYVKEEELCKSPEKLCMLECEEENATEEETDELLEFEELLDDAKTIMPLDNQPTREIEVRKDVLCEKAVQAKKADEVMAVVKSDEYSTEELVYKLGQLPNVDSVAPNYKREPVEEVPPATGNYTDKQWAYNPSLNKWHMNIPDWNKPNNKNAEGVVVAVLDTGVNYNHEDLKNVMWDDGLNYPALTGLGGGKYGIFTAAERDGADRGSTDPMDTHNHGTHCAGIIGAEWNGIGVSGAANGVEIMALRGGKSSFYDDDLIEGMEYALTAKQNGVNVVAINNSWGGKPGYEDEEMLNIEKAINQLGNEGIISCFAAGNEKSNCDEYQEVTEKGVTYRGYYQAKYLHDLESTLIIGSCGREGTMAYYSNYGKESVDIFTPGGDSSNVGSAGEIYSTLTGSNNAYGWMQGTSMACPAAVGAIAIIRAQNPDKSMSEIISAVKACAKTENTKVNGLCETNGYLDVGTTLEYLSPKIKVTFNTNGGSNISSQNVIEGGKASRPNTNPTKKGYTFVGWYENSDLTIEFNFDSTITKETTIYAKWEIADDDSPAVCEHKNVVTHSVGNYCYYKTCGNCGVITSRYMTKSYLKGLKAKKSKKYFTVKWKKQSKKNRKKFSGYKIQYKQGASGAVKTTSASSSKSSKKIKAKRKTVYYYRVCTYWGSYLATWSGWKKIKTK